MPVESPSQAPRLLAIGDIHGCSRAFESLLSIVKPTPGDTLVTLGDYIDRGPDSKDVIERLITLQKETQLIPLRGNHEIMMMDSRQKGGEVTALWMMNGGDTTVDSYGAKTLDDIPEEHWTFLNNTQRFWETDTHIFVHAGVDPSMPLSAQSDIILFWQHLTREIRHISGKPIVCGHTPQRNGIPWITPGTLCLDTAACRGAWLTCLDLLNGTCWQANEDGESRSIEIDLSGRSVIDF
jgi:serine/threonine protein phosphatase 1